MKTKTIMSSKVAKALTKKLNNHFKSLRHQPVTIVFEQTEHDVVDIEIRSAEGTMKFEANIQNVK